MIDVNMLQLTVVTPETTLLNEQVLSVRFPLEDGEIGILPDHAPMVGRLGIGELIVTSSAGKRSYFVDGGFAQVKGNAVTLLTNDARDLASMPAGSAARLEEAFQEALNRKARTPGEIQARQHDMDRNRKLQALLSQK
ncbi:MAG: ATP synthase F1 subunit epsilon [Planctomycetaceae bacterium]